MKCTKVLFIFVVSFLIFPVMAQQKYNLPVSAEKYYSEMKKGVLNGIILKMVHGTLEDKSKEEEVMRKIDESIDMEQIKADTWPCLSKLPESEWYTNTECFNGFVADVGKNAMRFVALANANKNLNSRSTSSAAVQKGAQISYNNAMARYYANNLLHNISQLSLVAMTANAGEGKDMSFSDSGLSTKNSPIPSKITLLGKKNGSVLVNFPDQCIAKDFKVDANKFIEVVKDELKKSSHITFTCNGHKCIWKMK